MTKDASMAEHADYSEDTALLEEAARKAGELALSYFKHDPKAWTKDKGSPVTEADIAANNLLANMLIPARPDYGWLSEESKDNAERLQKSRLFVVDPIDGTRGFIKGSSDWTVSVAIVENGRPVSAALYAPVSKDMYLSTKGHGAKLNNRRLTCPQVYNLNGARGNGPAAVIKKGLLAEKGVEPSNYVYSLAHRIVMVASGKLDLTLARDNSHDWDLAAADLILTEAGGVLCEKTGGALVYNCTNPVHQELYAACPLLGEQIRPLMDKLHFPARQ